MSGCSCAFLTCNRPIEYLYFYQVTHQPWHSGIYICKKTTRKMFSITSKCIAFPCTSHFFAVVFRIHIFRLLNGFFSIFSIFVCKILLICCHINWWILYYNSTIFCSKIYANSFNVLLVKCCCSECKMIETIEYMKLNLFRTRIWKTIGTALIIRAVFNELIVCRLISN